MHRRQFLREALVGGAALSAAAARAGEGSGPAPERMGVLVDTTVCIGCRTCEWACKRAHDIPTAPLATYEDEAVMERPRRPDTANLTVVNRHALPPPAGGQALVKVQCMHCAHPACVSACIVGALTKRADGAVVWDTDKCIGCRYCMVACPFQVPSFEYDQALKPRILKCDFCAARREAGALPACVEACPVEALTFGPREDLVAVARNRVRKHPERYVPHVFGEYEVGGTDWLYLGAADATALGFPRLGLRPAPGVSESIQHGIFAYFVPPVLLYALLGVVMWMNRNRPTPGQGEG